MIDLKSIQLKTNIEQLDEVTITAVVPIQIKNDTTAYNVSSFKIHHDDTIEDLLKKLPGIELDTDGSIKAQGNDITKIYVDGKEFFSGDPSIVLKNLSADAISKVEVIDKKSDEAELTGVNDGQKAYVINLTLKKSKKRSGFGKLAAGIGLDNRYFSNINYNRFSPKTQLSVIGKYNNLNMTGSNIQDFLRFTGGITDEQDETEQSSSLEKNKKGLSGYLTTGVGGVHFGYELKKKEVINADYFYNVSENTGTSHSKRTSYSRLRNYFLESENNNQSTSDNHHLNFNYENKSSSRSRLFIKGSLTTDQRTSNTNRYVSYFDELFDLKNTSDIQYSNKNNRKNGSVKLNYYRKLNPNKRNFGVGLLMSSNKVSNQKEQNSLNTIISTLNTNEIFTLKNEQFKNNVFNFNFRFTEPLGNNHFLKLQFNYVFRNGSERIDQTKKRNDKDEQPLNYEVKSHEKRYTTKLTYNYSTEILNFYVGSELQELDRIFGLIMEENYRKNEVYLNPTFSLRYKPTKGKNYAINYKRVIRSPKNYQSAPVINDLNPYYLKMGNPNLLTEKLDNVNIKTTNHNYSRSLSFYSKLTYQHIEDAIIPSLLIDDNFVKTRSFVNYGSQDKISAEFNINKRIRSLGVRYNLKTKGSYRTSNSIIELELNDVLSKEYLIGFSLENNKKNIFDLKAGVDYSVNHTNFSVEQNLNREFIKQHYYAKFDYDISKRFNINTQFDYFLYADSNFHSNQKIPFWNAGISYAITKQNNGILKLLFIDILDKNIDIERRSNINYFEETMNQMLGRYFLVSFTLRLNGNGKKMNNKKRKKNIS